MIVKKGRMRMLSLVLSWLKMNWLPLVLCGVVFAGYLWVANLRSTIKDQEQEIKDNRIEIARVTDIAVKQSQAFEVLKEEFDRYEAQVSKYIQDVAQIKQENDALLKDFEKEVPQATLDSPVDPYLENLLERLRQARNSTGHK